jgi:hypothetical protein
LNIQQTIAWIDQELSQMLADYKEWFNLSEDLLTYKPSVGWSIEQILEHVTITNYYLLILIRKGKRKAKERSLKVDLLAAVSDYQNNLGDLQMIATHKSFKWIRPEHMEPKGEKPLDEIKSLLEEQVMECKAILRELSNGEGILYKTTMTVNGLGKIDVYQYVYFLCQHAKRHITQIQDVIEEVKILKKLNSREDQGMR